jgi:hypothetical protein
MGYVYNAIPAATTDATQNTQNGAHHHGLDNEFPKPHFGLVHVFMVVMPLPLLATISHYCSRCCRSGIVLKRSYECYRVGLSIYDWHRWIIWRDFEQ